MRLVQCNLMWAGLASGDPLPQKHEGKGLGTLLYQFYPSSCRGEFKYGRSATSCEVIKNSLLLLAIGDSMLTMVSL